MVREIYEDAEIWNVADHLDVRTGRKQPLRVSVKVDNGSADCVIPETIATQLGLMRDTRKVWVKYADGRRAQKEVAWGLCLRLPRLDREWQGNALIEPGRQTVLLGCEPMEHMEVVADHREGRLYPKPGTENGQVSVIE